VTAQVVFLNTNYYPSIEQRAWLETIQDHLNSARAGLMNRILTYSPYNKMLAIQKHHEEIRKHIKLVAPCVFQDEASSFCL
jgi:hypothetical protein